VGRGTAFSLKGVPPWGEGKFLLGGLSFLGKLADPIWVFFVSGVVALPGQSAICFSIKFSVGGGETPGRFSRAGGAGWTQHTPSPPRFFFTGGRGGSGGKKNFPRFHNCHAFPPRAGQAGE